MPIWICTYNLHVVYRTEIEDLSWQCILCLVCIGYIACLHSYSTLTIHNIVCIVYNICLRIEYNAYTNSDYILCIAYIHQATVSSIYGVMQRKAYLQCSSYNGQCPQYTWHTYTCDVTRVYIHMWETSSTNSWQSSTSSPTDRNLHHHRPVVVCTAPPDSPRPPG